MMDMGFWPDVQRIVATLPRDAADAALLGDDARRGPRAGARPSCATRGSIASGHAQRPGPHDHARGRVGAGRRAKPSGWRQFLKRETGAGAGLRAHEARRRPAGRAAGGGRASARRRCTPTARRQQRSAAVEGLRSGRYTALVATDVAARGLDIDGITHVINYEVPDDARGLRAPRRTHRPCEPDRHCRDTDGARGAEGTRHAGARRRHHAGARVVGRRHRRQESGVRNQDPTCPSCPTPPYPPYCFARRVLHRPGHVDAQGLRGVEREDGSRSI